MSRIETSGLASQDRTMVVSVLVELVSERLVLRPMRDSDLPRLVAVAGLRDIADTTVSVSHPFTTDHAQRWINENASDRTAGTAYGFAITLAGYSDELIGYITLKKIDRQHCQAELSFWLDPVFQGKGYALEAAQLLVRVAFKDLGINRLHAYSMVRNPASARLLAKLNFKQEGYLRQRVRKWGVFEDVLAWGLLSSDAQPE